MAQVRRRSGVRVMLPEGYRLSRSREGSRRAWDAAPVRSWVFRAGRRPAAEQAAERAALLAAFRAQGMELVDVIEAVPGRSGGGQSGPAARRKLDLEVPVDDAETAIVITEQDGLYGWHPARRVRPGSGGARRPGGPVRKLADFSLAIRASPDAVLRASRRRARAWTELVEGKIRALVLKFLGSQAVRLGMAVLERHVRSGLVVINGTDSSRWVLIQDPAALQVRPGRAFRVLLWIHGTFSSTMGSFGALAATPNGQALLASALKRYSLVLGYDHQTLSRDPRQNAVDLLGHLERLPGQRPPELDVVAFSRGGLVLRSLVEQLLPHVGWPARFGRVVFVACPHGGTRLAEPDNWHTLVDLYLNLALAAARTLAVLPGTEVAAAVLRHALQGLAALIKFLATHAVDRETVPGLAAMEPDGRFVTELNRVQPGQPAPGSIPYFVIGSDFDPEEALRGESVRELPRRLLLLVADGLVDRLMGHVPNDLVVDTPAMSRIDPGAGAYVTDRLDLGTNPRVYHTVYFSQPEVIEAVRRWLKLPRLGPAARVTL